MLDLLETYISKRSITSKVTASKSVLSQIVWSKVVLTEVTVTVAFGTIVIFPFNIEGSQIQMWYSIVIIQ